jgi:hypothetical protein
MLTASIIRAIEAAITSETSVNYQTTRRSNSEDSCLHARSRENLKSHYSWYNLYAKGNGGFNDWIQFIVDRWLLIVGAYTYSMRQYWNAENDKDIESLWL